MDFNNNTYDFSNMFNVEERQLNLEPTKQLGSSTAGLGAKDISKPKASSSISGVDKLASLWRSIAEAFTDNPDDLVDPYERGRDQADEVYSKYDILEPIEDPAKARRIGGLTTKNLPMPVNAPVGRQRFSIFPEAAEEVAEEVVEDKVDDGLMSDPRKLGGSEGYGSLGKPVDSEDSLMRRPKARPTGLRDLDEIKVNKAAQEYLGITVDGDWGPASTRTLAGWQYQNDIPVSGELDDATIDAMENPTTEDPRKPKQLKSVLNDAGDAPDMTKIKSWAKENISDPVKAAAFVATVEAETGQSTLVESGHTTASAVRVFVTNNKYMHVDNDLTKPLDARGLRRKQKLEALGSGATGDEIFDFIYGSDADAVGSRLGNTQPSDGSTFKGRGLIQLSGRDNYQRVGDIMGVDLVSNPELVNDPKYAAAVAMAYLSLPGKDFFDGDLTSTKLASVIGHQGSGAARWTRTTELKNEMYP